VLYAQRLDHGALSGRKIEDRLVIQKADAEREKERLRLEENGKRTAAATFHPSITPRKEYVKRESAAGFANQWDYLYEDSHQKNKNLKRDVTGDERTYASARGEFTFQPNPDK